MPTTASRNHHAARSGTSLHVICAEDDVDICNALQGILEMFGHRVTCAFNGKEALACIRRSPTPVDLLITDHQMPVMSGCELVARARKSGYAGRILIYCTPLSYKDAALYRRFGVTEFLEKPALVNAIINAVQSPSGTLLHV